MPPLPLLPQIYAHNQILILIGPQLILTEQIAKFLVKPNFLNLCRQIVDPLKLFLPGQISSYATGFALCWCREKVY